MKVMEAKMCKLVTWNKSGKCGENTEVSSCDGWTRVYLHGYCIAEIAPNGRRHAGLQGYGSRWLGSVTTRSRINALLAHWNSPWKLVRKNWVPMWVNQVTGEKVTDSMIEL